MTTELTVALERHDRHLPFFMGMITPPDGITLKVLEVGMAPPRRDGIDPHPRFWRGDESDICEMSLSSCLTAKSRAPATRRRRCSRAACSARTTCSSTPLPVSTSPPA